MGSDFGLQCRALQRALSIVAAVTLSNLLGHKQLHVERAQPPQGLFVGYPGTRSQYASQSLKRRASVTEVSPAELESSIRRGGAVVLDVYAVWCGPCKLLEPALNILADKLESDVEKEGSPSPQVLRMDSDRHSAKASEMGVEGLPTIIFFNEGVEVGRLEGAVGLGELEEKAAEALGLAELSGGPSIIQLNKLEELEVMVQLEEMVLVGVLGLGKWEQQSSALDGTLQLLQRQLGDQLQVVIVDASKLPGRGNRG
ncbi:Thioredoxin Y1 [Durusdinium trenchii]|uniref:Chloroplastic (AtTrxy1) n=1 Tax=Durusdinium trenchii TaxID=1381693 RepID=A0ABP0Q3M6_9DINO